MGYLIAFLIFIIALLGYYIYVIAKGVILLDEMEVGVIFNKRNNNFAYFIDSDVAPTEKINNFAHKQLNNILPKYRHFINPFTEKHVSTITRGTYNGGDETFARTKEGIPVTVSWTVKCRINVTEILPSIEHKMARGLPDNAGKMATGKGISAVRHIVEQKTIYQLYEEDAVKDLETELCDEIIKRTKIFGMIGMKAGNQIQIKSIEMPPQIEKALKVAHQRKIQTETITKALTDLKEAIDGFTPDDMERLAELERLRIVDDKSTSMVYWMSNTLKNKHVHHLGKNGAGAEQEGN